VTGHNGRARPGTFANASQETERRAHRGFGSTGNTGNGVPWISPACLRRLGNATGARRCSGLTLRFCASGRRRCGIRGCPGRRRRRARYRTRPHCASLACQAIQPFADRPGYPALCVRFRYSTAAARTAGSSWNLPRPWLQEAQSRPRNAPVTWSWSMHSRAVRRSPSNGSRPQISQRP
jgi:hypothetical protein